MKKLIVIAVAMYLIWLSPHFAAVLEEICPAIVTSIPYVLGLGVVGLVLFNINKNGTSYF
jgi:hypothetical protein